MASLIFERTGKCDELLAELEALEQHDKEIEAKKKKAMIGCGVVCVLALASFIATGVTDGKQTWTIACLAIFGVLAVIMLITCSVYSSKDIEDRRYEVGKTLFTMLGKDVPPKGKCVLTVSFQTYQKHGELLEKSGGWASTIKEFSYADTWFKARGTLYDGNVFQLAIKQSVKRKEKHKRKRTKVTEKFTEDVVLTLDLNAESYPKFAEAKDNIDTTKPVANLQIKNVTQNDRRLKVTATTGRKMRKDALVTGDSLLGVFVHVYSCLRACRA